MSPSPPLACSLTCPTSWRVFIVVVLSLFDTRSCYLTQAGLVLTMNPRLGLDSQFSCLSPYSSPQVLELQVFVTMSGFH